MELFGLSLWFQRKTNPINKMTECRVWIQLINCLSVSLSLSLSIDARRGTFVAPVSGVIMLLAEHINVDFYPLFLHSVCICM